MRIGDVAKQIRGVTYSRSDALHSPAPGYVSLLRAGNIQDGALSLEDLVYVPERLVQPRQMLQVGDVVIATSSGSLEVVGKAAANTGGFNGAFGAFLKVLRPSPDIDASYFGHFFQTPAYRRLMSTLAAGANINNLKSAHLDELELLLPAIAEQRRIARILDLAQALRSRHRAVVAGLNSLVQARFLQLFDDPNQPSRGSELLEFDQVFRDDTRNSPKVNASDFESEGLFPVVDQGARSTAGWKSDVDLTTDPGDGLVVFGDHTRRVKLVTHRFVLGADGAKVLRPQVGIDARWAATALSLIEIPSLGYSRHMKVVRELHFPRVELQRQKAFAEFAKRVERDVARVRSPGRADELFASLQHRAFSGML